MNWLCHALQLDTPYCHVAPAEAHRQNDQKNHLAIMANILTANVNLGTAIREGLYLVS